jgi:GPH family glycoside/pentoside/hexuronide:cation symporter
MSEAVVEPPLAALTVPKAKLPLRLILGWGVGSFAASTMYQVTTVLLLRYLVDYVGLAAVAAGALISLTKIFDAVIDPFIGVMSDRTRSRWGRRRPYIVIGGVVSALSFVALFSLPHMPPGAVRTLVVAAALMVNTAGYALLSIPHLAMPTEMTADFQERTYIMSFRVGGLSLAQLSGTVLGPYLIARYGGGAHGHAVMSVVVGGIILIGALICFAGTKGAPATVVSDPTGFTTWSRVKLAFGNRPFVSLMGCKLANLTSVAWYFAILPFLFTTVTKAGYKQLSLYFFVQGLATLGGQPFWVWLSKGIGKKRTFYVSSVGYGLAIASWFLAAAGDPAVLTVARAAVIGGLGGGALLAASSLLPDAIAHDFHRTGLRREGIFAGVYTTVEKASAAFAATLIGAGLSLGGYVQGAGGHDVQPASAVMVIRLATLAPLVFCVIAALVLTTYTLADKRGDA